MQTAYSTNTINLFLLDWTGFVMGCYCMVCSCTIFLAFPGRSKVLYTQSACNAQKRTDGVLISLVLSCVSALKSQTVVLFIAFKHLQIKQIN